MKIDGPKGVQPNAPATSGAEGADGADAGKRAEAPRFGDALAGAAGPTDAAPVSELAQRIEAGAISGPEAVDAMIEAVVQLKIAQGLTPGGAEQLRSALREVVAQDPTLAATVRRLAPGAE